MFTESNNQLPPRTQQRAKRKKAGTTETDDVDKPTDAENQHAAATSGGGDAGKKPSTDPKVPVRAKIGGQEKSNDNTVVWTRIAPGNHSGRRGAQNVLRESGGPTGYAKQHLEKDCYSSALKLFLTEPMLRLIKHYTEKEARQVLRDESWTLSLTELDAFLSILYARGACVATSTSVSDLWDKEWGPPFFSETMSRDRFREIMRFLRFDDRDSRARRKETDKFCLVSELWNKFVENCLACYRPDENITVDEQLYPTKCRCPFLQYMANKPDKFGIKFWVATDAKIRYVINAFPYLGKDEARPSTEGVGENVVKRLVEPFLNKGRNVTMDNFFTSVSLAKDLRKKKTSLVGTLNRNRKEVPNSLKKSKDVRFSSAIYKHEDITLTSYQAKSNKNVLILSSMHPDVQINTTTEKKKPETVLFYNKTKCGVDTVDQMTRKYSVRSGTRRWPVHVFYNILDLAMINAHSLYKLIFDSNISRKSFILKVVKEMSKPYADSRIMLHAKDVLPSNVAVRKTCQIGLCNENKTKKSCHKCKKRVCGKCQSEQTVCKKCERT